MRELENTLGTFTTVQLHSYMANQALEFMPELYIQPFYSGSFEQERKPITLTPLLPTKQEKPARRPITFVKEAKVLLSITLHHSKQTTQEMMKEMQAWLMSRDRPYWVKGVELVGVLPSASSVLLITLPIALWDVLPEDPAYKMTEFVTGGNVLLENADQRLLSRLMSQNEPKGHRLRAQSADSTDVCVIGEYSYVKYKQPLPYPSYSQV